jgi:hypothetical protein
MSSLLRADESGALTDYMVHKLGVDEAISLDLCVLLYKQYGTTMAGLRVRALLHSSRIIYVTASFLFVSWP